MTFTAKTWKDGDKVPASDFNRIEQGVADANGRLVITQVDSPTIDLTEPADAEQIEDQMYLLINALKQAGVFK